MHVSILYGVLFSLEASFYIKVMGFVEQFEICMVG